MGREYIAVHPPTRFSYYLATGFWNGWRGGFEDWHNALREGTAPAHLKTLAAAAFTHSLIEDGIYP